jgi:uncharacterized protein YoaH (UPF0181 family)
MKLENIGKRLMWMGAAGLFALPAIATADHHTTMTITAEAALEVDILLAIDLPLIAHEARESGIDEQEIEVALTSAMQGGISAGNAAEIVANEVEETRKQGEPRENFGQWVRRQVAEGVTGRELAQSIRERKAELAALSDEEEKQLDERLNARKEERRAYRAELRKKREELRAEGKTLSIRGKEEHEARKQALVAARGELIAAGKNLRAGGRALGHAKGIGPGPRGRAGEVEDDELDEDDRDDAPGKGKSVAADMKADAAKTKSDSKADIAKVKADAAKTKSDAKADAAKTKSDAKADAAKAKADAKGKVDADVKGSSAGKGKAGSAGEAR